MDDTTRFSIAAEAASIVSRLNPGAPDSTIGTVVGQAMAEMITAGIEPTTAELASHADAVIEAVHLGALTTRIVQSRRENVEMDLDTAFADLALTDEERTGIEDELTQLLDLPEHAVDLTKTLTIRELVEQISQTDDECPCGNPHCSGNGPARAEREDDEIREYGVSFRPVLAGEGSPGFIYSIGMSDKGQFDALFIGDCAPATAAYLGMVIDMQKNGAELAFGRIEADDPRNFFDAPVWIVPADGLLDTMGFGITARLERSGSQHQARLAQIVFPDKKGLFPWEDGYSWIDQQVSGPEGTPAN